MNIREQLEVLLAHGVEFIVVGGQAGVLRQAVEFSHDLNILVRATRENAERLRDAVCEIAHQSPDVALLLGRDFQQYVDPDSGTEIDVHLKLVALPSYEAGLANASAVDYLGASVQVLELPALFASKRTDRPRDAVHRQAIAERLALLVVDGHVEADDVVLACCMDRRVADVPEVLSSLGLRARTTAQPLLQLRLVAFGLHAEQVAQNPNLHETARALLALDEASRTRLTQHPGRLWALLARVPLVLPANGYHVVMK
jgi:hypothetical protein